MRRYILFGILLLLIPVSVWATDGVNTVEHPAKVNTVVTPDKVNTVIGLAAAGCVAAGDTCAEADAGDHYFGNTEVTQWIATKFTSGGSGYTVCAIGAQLAKLNTPSFNVTAMIYTDNADSPGTQVGDASDAVAASTFDGTEILFSSVSAPLDASTSYWVVLKPDGYNATNHAQWDKASLCTVEHIQVTDNDPVSWTDTGGSTNRSGIFQLYK